MENAFDQSGDGFTKKRAIYVIEYNLFTDIEHKLVMLVVTL